MCVFSRENKVRAYIFCNWPLHKSEFVRSSQFGESIGRAKKEERDRGREREQEIPTKEKPNDHHKLHKNAINVRRLNWFDSGATASILSVRFNPQLSVSFFCYFGVPRQCDFHLQCDKHWLPKSILIKFIFLRTILWIHSFVYSNFVSE